LPRQHYIKVLEAGFDPGGQHRNHCTRTLKASSSPDALGDLAPAG
jgi:hypothetical protein